MVKVGKKIAKHRIAILIIGFLLLIPSAFGYFKMTKSQLFYSKLLTYGHF